MDDSKSDRIWLLYKIFYIAQSTAFIVPILYLFLQTKYGLSSEEILQITSFYFFFTFIFEIPCAIIADRWGAKKNLIASLFLQIASCLSLILIKQKIAYHFYLIFTSIAQAIMNGASIVFIKKQLAGMDDGSFRENLFKLQNSFYKTTSVFIIISSLIYQIDNFIPFFFQIANFSVSIFALSKIPNDYISSSKKSTNIFNCAKLDLKKSLSFILMDKKYLYLIVCGVFFGLGVSINQKSIQPQIYELIDTNQIILIGLVIAIGNLFSSYGARFIYEKLPKNLTVEKELLFLSLFMSLSYALLSFANIFSAVLGFFLINIFKGYYRPIISAELANQYPFKSSLNTNLAVISLIGVCISSTFQFGISFFYTNIEYGNFTYGALSFAIVLLIYFYAMSYSDWKIRGVDGLISKKHGYIQKKDNELEYIQIYPKETSHESLALISDAIAHGRYPTHNLIILELGKGQHGIKTKYYGDVHLCDISDAKKQYLFCETLLNHVKNKPIILFPKANSLAQHHILKPEHLNMLQRERLLSNTGLIHGDLNPENILIYQDKPYVIDWDLCMNGPFWFDLLSLITHPSLSFGLEKRINLFRLFSDQFSDKEIKEIFSAFSDYKAFQLRKFSEIHPKYSILSKDYSGFSSSCSF